MTEQSDSTSKQVLDELHRIRLRLAAMEAAVRQLQGNAAVATPPPLPSHITQPSQTIKAEVAAQPLRPSSAVPVTPVIAQQASVAPAAVQPTPSKPVEFPPAGFSWGQSAATSPATPKPAPVAEPVRQSPKPTAAPVPVAMAAPAPSQPPAAKKPVFNLEQFIGIKGMSIAGAVLLILGGVFFFMLALEKGWIDARMRLIIGSLFGLAIIAGGEYCIRRNMRMFAAVIIGVGIVWLYQVVFLASPKGLYERIRFIGPEVSFCLMFVVTLLGIAMSVRAKLLTTAIISLVGAMATPVLLSTGKNAQAILMCYLLVIDAGFLLLAYFRRWQALAPLTLAGTAILFVGWYGQYYDSGQFASTVAFAWALAGLHAIWCVMSEKAGRAHTIMSQTLLVLSAVGIEALIWNTCNGADYRHQFAVQSLVVAAGVLAWGLWKRQPIFVMLANMAALTLAWIWLIGNKDVDYLAPTHAYAWAFVVLSALCALAPMARKWTQVNIVNIAFAGAAMTLMLFMTCNGYSFVHTFGIEMLIVAGGVLAWGLWQRQPVFVMIANMTALALAWIWLIGNRDSLYPAPTHAYAWAFAILSALCALSPMARTWAKVNLVNIASAGAAMTIMLFITCNGYDFAHTFGIEMLIVAAGVLAYAIRFGHAGLLISGYAVAVMVNWAWFLLNAGRPMVDDAWIFACSYSWIYLAGPLAVLFIPRVRNWSNSQMSMLAVFATYMVLGWLVLGVHLPTWSMAWQLVALNVIVLGVCQWRNWHLLRLGLLAWTLAGLVGQYFYFSTAAEDFSMMWFTTGWVWAFFGLIVGDILIRAWRKSLEMIEAIDAGLACAATALMFAATYALLYKTYPDWMGLYTASLSAGIVVIVWAVHKLAGRKLLASAFMAQSLVLLAMAAPIQLDYYEVVLAWSLMAVPAMLLARPLGSRLLWLFSPVVLMLAMLHLQYDTTIDPEGAISVFGWAMAPLDCHKLSLAVWTVASLLSAGALRYAKPILSDAADLMLAQGIVGVAAVFMAYRTTTDLSATWASWVWLTLAAVLAVTALWRTSRWLSVVALVMLAATAGKWMIYDTLIRRVAGLPEPSAFLTNGQFIIGLTMCAGLLVYLKMLAVRGLGLPAGWRTALGLLAAFMVLWAGSFEIDRYYCPNGAPAAGDIAQAMQITYSLWWAIYAAAVLAIGFILSKPPTRYLAIAVFAVTLGKVFITDLSHVEMVYRVLSFIGLGVLLLGGSLLYHRQFRTKA